MDKLQGTRWLSLRAVVACLFFSLLASCQLSDPTNPIYREAPETYFAAGPALAAARAIRAEDAAALDKAFAAGLDPNLPGNKGVTLPFWAYAHHSVPMLQALVRHGAEREPATAPAPRAASQRGRAVAGKHAPAQHCHPRPTG